MEAKARLVDASRTLDGDLRLSFEVEAPVSVIDDLKDKLLRLTAVVWREKRSNDANAYFHKLCRMLANERTIRGDTISDVRQKNELIGKYGQPHYTDKGERSCIKTNMPPEIMLEQEHLHLRLKTTNDRGDYFYWCYRESHTYDSKEMAILINGTIEDCKEWGVEYLTPDQLGRLINAWNPS